ncbi:hypothetical protein ACW9UR_02585 [Halovulum sp. GXIMD14794]
MTRLAHAWKHHRLLLTGFVLAVAIALAMLVKLLFAWVYWSANHQQAVAGWMTPGYVAHSWKLDRDAFFDRLSGPLELTRGQRETISEIAKRKAMTEAEVIALIEAAVADLDRDPAQ